MIISPPLLRERSDTESDADWVNRMMAADPQRSFPVNRRQSWHGGLHLTGNGSDPVRCIADGKVISLRQPDTGKHHVPPLNYNGTTDNGYVLLKHETETGSGDDGQIVYYSLYMHLNSIDANVSVGKTLYRKSPAGTAGMVDGQSGYHFQIFCDDENIRKITGRTTPETDLTKDGRTDVVYGDIHFYLPAGTTVYEAMPEDNSLVNNSPLKKTGEPLFVTMSFDRGNCTVVTRRQNSATGIYPEVGEPLMNADGEDYEYNLYASALKLYPESPSAGYEMLRFGRVINTDYETLVPADAPLWRTVNTPQGKGIVNLGARDIRVYSDGDFPHWTGWQLVDDDTDTNSQCNSPTVLCAGSRDVSRMICHFPLEWDSATVDSRFEWLKSVNEVLSKPMAECDWNLLTAHGKALCLAENPLPSGRVWHFDPRQFIAHFRKCGWLSLDEIAATFPKYMFYSGSGNPREAITTDGPIYTLTKEVARERIESWHKSLNQCMLKYIGNDKKRVSIFLAQVLLETAQWRDLGGSRKIMHEWGFGKYNRFNPATEYYTIFYGRGIMQLTWSGNYYSYGKYKKMPGHSGEYIDHLSPENKRITQISRHYTYHPDNGGKLEVWYPKYDPDIVADNEYMACDSGGFYWVSKSFSEGLSINRVADRTYSPDNVGFVSRLVNGGSNGYYERQAYTLFILCTLTDRWNNVDTELVSPTGKSSIIVNLTPAG